MCLTSWFGMKRGLEKISKKEKAKGFEKIEEKRKTDKQTGGKNKCIARKRGKRVQNAC